MPLFLGSAFYLFRWNPNANFSFSESTQTKHYYDGLQQQKSPAIAGLLLL
jgi:hypothetical protein